MNVRERDFKMVATVARVRPGLVTFRVHNLGPSTHEFVVVRTAAADDALPLSVDRLTIDEDARSLHEVASLSAVRLGATSSVTARLTPGHYVLFCNLEGHYRGGMFAPIEVTR